MSTTKLTDTFDGITGHGVRLLGRIAAAVLQEPASKKTRHLIEQLVWETTEDHDNPVLVNVVMESVGAVARVDLLAARNIANCAAGYAVDSSALRTQLYEASEKIKLTLHLFDRDGMPDPLGDKVRNMQPAEFIRVLNAGLIAPDKAHVFPNPRLIKN